MDFIYADELIIYVTLLHFVCKIYNVCDLWHFVAIPGTLLSDHIQLCVHCDFLLGDGCKGEKGI